MNDASSATGSTRGTSRRGRPGLAPMTRAVRLALTASVAVFAMAGSASAFAGTCTPPADGVIHCNGAFTGTIVFPDVADLTLVLGDSIPTSVTPGNGMAGILANGSAPVTIDNRGDIDVTDANGIDVTSSGDIAIANSGSVTTTGTDKVIAIYAQAYGDADIAIDNSGSASASSDGLAVAISAYADSGTIDIDNSGTLEAFTTGELFPFSVDGITASSEGDVTITSSGDINVSEDYAFTKSGIFGRSELHHLRIVNDGHISVSGTSLRAQGVYADGWRTYATNGGDIDVSGTSYVRGIYARGVTLVEIENSGNVNVEGTLHATGLFADISFGASETSRIDNSGSVHVHSGDSGFGASALQIVNSGDIGVAADAGTAYGVAGSRSLLNSGSIIASSPVRAVAVSGSGTIENSGVISAEGAGDQSIAILSIRDTVVHNSGDIHGAFVSGLSSDYAESFYNDVGGEWIVDNRATDFSFGNDRIVNASGATIRMDDGSIRMGGFDGVASFDNSGLLEVGGFGEIDMGGTTGGFANDGVIDLVDGNAWGQLSVHGFSDAFAFSGDGAIDVDVDASNGHADLLTIGGDVAAGTRQEVNVALAGGGGALPGGTFDVVRVTGDAAADAFVAGQVLGFDPSNFVDLGLTLGRSEAAGATVFSASVAAQGLNDAGVLAAGVAPGVHRLVASSIGTSRERMGIGPMDAGDTGLGAWIRLYGEEGNVAPRVSGFGSGGDFGFSQSSRGREAGVDYAFGNGFSVGLLAGDADGTQRLTGASGTDRLQLDSSGVYATWTMPDFYLDASYRWLHFDAELVSAAGMQATSGKGKAFDVEAGWTGWSPGGIAVVPQLQYTRTSIDGIDPIHGSTLEFVSDASVSERARLGVEFSKAFTSGRYTWSPYGAVSSVREFDDKAFYNVAGASGAIGTGGSSAMLALGLGLRSGGFSATVSGSWADGGALDGMSGGNLVLRYGW